MIRISVIIVNYNARYFLNNCLNSILSSDMLNDVEIIVVDNASTDTSSEMLRAVFPDIHVICNNENVGFAQANNQAVGIAQGDYVLILNPDTMLTETTLSEMLTFAEKQDNFGAAGVQFIDGKGNYLPECKRNFPDIKVAGAKLIGYSKYYYANHLDKDDVAEIDVLTGAFMFVKKEVYDELEGFDETFFMYGEDIDLSYCISKAGYKNFYVGTSKILHFKGESTVKDKVYFENFYGALSIFYKKHFPNKGGLYALVDGLIEAMIRLKSARQVHKTTQKTVIHDWVYIGKDRDVFERLKKLHARATSFKMNNFEDSFSSPEVVFFDSKELEYSHIIDAMTMSDLSEAKKRIISAEQDYYLGSDASNERGEVVNF